MNRLVCFILLIVLLAVPVKAQNIEDVSEAGSYEVTINGNDAEGKRTEKDVLLLIRFRNTVVDTDSREAIDGVNIRYTNSETISDMNSQELIQRANARAWNIDTGQSIAITTVNVNGNSITFATENNTAMTIQAYQVDNLGMNLQSSYIEPLVGRNFNVANTLAFISGLLLIPVFLILLFQIRVQKEFKSINKTLYKQ